MGVGIRYQVGEMTWGLLGDGGMRDEECANLLSQRVKTAANEETAQDKTKPTSQKTPAEVEFPSTTKNNLGGGGVDMWLKSDTLHPRPDGASCRNMSQTVYLL
ncbi:uncharacterized protein LAJ45_01344 [Morchella importuna]|uniref:uncharacterized protein n=1 Tax=Morchella importuna TaxID=1174673 RepID=UPI001E8CBB99|nr:uncharacterized protein LAJ45_01344 [Morchella importuna]KAH8154813.1 hypothetical protein LAJ45_01344 [Morchella importuna]